MGGAGRFTYPHSMSESDQVTVRANLAVLGLRRNQKTTVERTPLIQAALDSGKLSEVAPEDAPPAETADAPPAEPTKAADDLPIGSSRRKAADAALRAADAEDAPTAAPAPAAAGDGDVPPDAGAGTD